MITAFAILVLPNASSFILPFSLSEQHPSIQIISRQMILTATRGGQNENIKDTASRKTNSYSLSSPIIGSPTFYDEDELCPIDTCLLNEHFSADSDSRASVSTLEKYTIL